MMHHHQIRRVNGGQFGLIVLCGKKKSQGKSKASECMTWMTGELIWVTRTV